MPLNLVCCEKSVSCTQTATEVGNCLLTMNVLKQMTGLKHF